MYEECLFCRDGHTEYPPCRYSEDPSPVRRIMRIADQQIERWSEALGKLAEEPCPEHDRTMWTKSTTPSMGPSDPHPRRSMRVRCTCKERNCGGESSWSEEEAQFVEEALRCVDENRAGHWPTVAGWLACEVRRLRSEMEE